jgi:hypothetical protein
MISIATIGENCSVIRNATILVALPARMLAFPFYEGEKLDDEI